MDIDVIIPVYRPDKKLFNLLNALNKQTLRPQTIILINTEKKYFDELVWGTDFPERYPNVEVHHITKEEFDHGGTRRRAVRLSSAPAFVMMTQDAVPADNKLLENLVGGLYKQEKNTIAVAYARQLADDECGVLEIASREFNYPEQSVTKTRKDINTMGIKTFFCSDVCAAYRREIYDKLDGFVRNTLFNEDMIFASKAIKAGYAVRYQADAKVIHSHNYSNSQQLHRNFDLGVSQQQHPEVFKGVSSESEGKKLVVATTKKLISEKKVLEIPHFYVQCASKYAGYLLGKNYDKLPKKLVKKLTTNPRYFDKE